MNSLFFIAVAPGLALALAIYLTDRYDREPVSLLIKVFIFGCIIVVPTAFLEQLIVSFNVFGGYIGAAYTAFLVAGFTEEFFKRYVVLKVAFNHKEFNEKLDGIVYSVFSALGFATVENILYVVLRFSYNPYIGLYRGILSVPAHMLFGVTMGYYLSLAKYADSEEKAKINLRKSLVMPIILHGVFDFILMANIPQLMILFIPFVVFLWIINIKRLREYTVISRNAFLRKDNDDHNNFI